MTRPTYGYGADGPTPDDPDVPSSGASLPSFGQDAAPGEQAGTGSPDGSAGSWDGAGRSESGAAYGQVGPVDSASPGYGASAEETPTCPRHPDRVSYVRCKRCHRPACPQCQRPAAVGVLCSDCEHEVRAEQARTSPRTAMGGRMGSVTPVVTYVLVGLCVAGFLLQRVAPQAAAWLLFRPYTSLAFPWTFFTSGFLHGGVMHLLLNMVALWVVGGQLERLVGHWRYAAVYLVSVLAGHTAVLLLADPFATAWTQGTLGASGGIFGLFGSLLVVSRRLRGDISQIIILIALNLLITFTIPGISWQGHLGGLVMGGAMTWLLFALRPRATPGADREALGRRSAMIHAGVIAAGFALCLLLIGLKVALAPAGALPMM